MTWLIQKQIIDKTVKSELNRKFPLSKKFINLFLKKILYYIEKVQDIHDELYSCICDTINYENNICDFSYRHYLIDNDLNRIITMKETNTIVVNGTTGMRTWEVT